MTNYFAQVEPPHTSFWGLDPSQNAMLVYLLILLTIGITSAILFALSRIPSNFRRHVVVGITFISGFFYVLNWLLPKGKNLGDGGPRQMMGPIDLGDIMPVVQSVGQILQAMLLALGVMSILRVHFSRLYKKQPDSGYSAILLLSMFVMVSLGYSDFSMDRSIENKKLIVDAALRQQGPLSVAMRDQIVEWADLGAVKRGDDRFEELRVAAERKHGQRKSTAAEFDNEIQEAQSQEEELESNGQDVVRIAMSPAAAGATNQLTPEVATLAKVGIDAEKEQSKIQQVFVLFRDNGLLAMDAAMFSLIGFFILSAAYRAFRIRSIEAAILMVTALVVLLSFVPLGLMLTNSFDPNGFVGNFRVDTMRTWLISTVSIPSIRAIDLGLGLGLVAMSLRILLGLERGVSVD